MIYTTGKKIEMCAKNGFFLLGFLKLVIYIPKKYSWNYINSFFFIDGYSI